jgi:hypothetical protein
VTHCVDLKLRKDSLAIKWAEKMKESMDSQLLLPELDAYSKSIENTINVMKRIGNKEQINAVVEWIRGKSLWYNIPDLLKLHYDFLDSCCSNPEIMRKMKLRIYGFIYN